MSDPGDRLIGALDTMIEVANSLTPDDPVTAAPDTDSEDAAQTMLSGGFRHLPVEEGAELVGIVSLRDVLSARIGRS